MTSARTRRSLSSGEWILLAAVGAEIAVFAAIAQNFFTLENFFEILRLSVELGLLAVALTPVIVSGGIDLSVGSMMGLAAVLFGAAYHDWGLSLGGAAMVALAAGCAGGALNAWLIAYFNIPPLIVTLGTLSLFRGIAEGLTRGAVNYTDFPSSFLALGQGYAGGIFPTQLFVFIPILVVYSILLHRSVVGRAWYVIGFGAAGARYAGLPVQRRVATLYFLSGLVSSVAAIIYVAHLGQAKSDAGSGYELDGRCPGRDVRVRRARDGVGHGARSRGAVGAAERIAPGRPAIRIDRRADRHIACLDYCDRSAARDAGGG